MLLNTPGMEHTIINQTSMSDAMMNHTSGACRAELPSAKQSQYKTLYITLELIIAVLAIIGNFLVCLAITRTKKLQTVTNYFLVSLSVADILVGLVAIPCAVLADLGEPHHNLPLCLVMLSVLMVLTQSSVLSLLAVAAERYMAIILPFQYQRLMSPRRARLALLLPWVLAVISGCMPVIDWQKRPQSSVYCIFTCVLDMSFVVYCNFFCFLLLPLIAMYIIYARIFIIVRGQLRKIAQSRTRTISGGTNDSGSTDVEGRTGNDKSGITPANENETIFRITLPTSSEAGISNKAKMLRTSQEMQKATSLFLLLFLFTVCWIPVHVINCMLFFCPTCNVPMSVTLVTILLSHANSAINPLLYAYRMRSFRKALMGMWRALWTCKKN